MEEGKKPEELVPMYVEGRSVQASSFGSIWSRHRGPVLVGALLLLSLVVLLGSSLGRSTEEGGSSSAAMKTMDMPASPMPQTVQGLCGACSVHPFEPTSQHCICLGTLSVHSVP